MKLSCSQCNAENQVEIPDAFVRCEFCKSSLYIDIDEITVVYAFTPIVETQQLGMYLKRDFEKTGFNEVITIQRSAPLYFPFWRVEGSDKLERACSRFPGEHIKIPAGEKIFFDHDGTLEKNIEILSIDTQPGTAKKRTLYYVPFFQVNIVFNRKNYTFFVDAVTVKALSGAELGFISDERGEGFVLGFPKGMPSGSGCGCGSGESSGGGCGSDSGGGCGPSSGGCGCS